MARLVKPEWGTKRLCLECDAKFYDMLRDPITCPACETVLKPEAPPKSRRASANAAKAKAKAAPVEAEKTPPEDAIEEDVTAATGDGDDPAADIVNVALDTDGSQQDVIEDVTELGEDEDDMAEVLDGTVKDEPDT